MRRLATAALSLALSGLLAVPLSSQGQGTAFPDQKALTEGEWFISLRAGAKDRVRFFVLGAADSSVLYLRRFSTPSYYLDAFTGTELKVLLWPEPKRRELSIAPGAASFLRESEPAKLLYQRAKGSSPVPGASPYVGDWEVGDPPMAVSIRACERRDWKLVMYFPGDPLSAIPMGYYPLSLVGEGEYRSSGAYPDSLLRLEYESASGALLLWPQFSARPLAADLYDPVRVWRSR